MKLTSGSILASIALASTGTLVSGSPLAIRTNSSVVGAAYFMTNEPTGNHIVVSNIGSDGKLTFANAVNAMGRGAHGVTDPIGPDPLFSQGAVKASATANMLVAVNPGSNTVSMFSIDPQNPSALTLVNGPVSSEGEFPMSVAINKNGTMVCVLNGGSVNGVQCYTPDNTLGLVAQNNTLRSLGLNQTTPATGPGGAASHVIFSEDGTKLIASVKGVPPVPGFLATWDIASDGSLSADFTKSTPASGGLLPFSMTVIPGKDAVLATDAGIGFSVFDFSHGDNASSTIIPISGQKATCWSSFSSKTGNFYLTDVGTSTVTEVNVDSNLNGSIVKQYPQNPNSATVDNDVATIGGDDFMYIMSPNTTSINVLSLKAPGQATALQTFDFSACAKEAGITINPDNLQGMTTFIKN